MYCGISDGLPSTLGCNLDLMVERCNDYFPQSHIVRIFPLKKGERYIYVCITAFASVLVCAGFFYFERKRRCSFFPLFLRDRHVVYPTVK